MQMKRFICMLGPIIASLILTNLFRAPVVQAEAFRILDQGAAATGQGTAFSAQADDPSAIHFNPAGIARLSGIQVSGGVILVGGKTTFTRPNGSKTKGTLDGTVAYPPPSHFYLTSDLKSLGIESVEGMAVGLGITSPFGLINKYPDQGPFNTVSTRNQLSLVDFKPTVAYAFHDRVSIGVGLDIYTFFDFIGEGHLEQKLNAGPEFGPLGIPLGTPLELNGKDSGVGFNVGILYTAIWDEDRQPILNLAFVYRSQVTLDLEGAFLVGGNKSADAFAQLELPQIFTGAVAYWPLRDRRREWKLEVDVEYADWSSLKDIDVTLSNGATLPFPLNWKGAWVWMVGTEYKWRYWLDQPGWTASVRAGYVRSESPVPEFTFSPAVPDSEYNAYSVGFGWMCEKQGSFFGWFRCGGKNKKEFALEGVGVDLAYQVVAYDSRTISRNRRPPVIGRWDTIFHVGVVNFRLLF